MRARVRGDLKAARVYFRVFTTRAAIAVGLSWRRSSVSRSRSSSLTDSGGGGGGGDDDDDDDDDGDDDDDDGACAIIRRRQCGGRMPIGAIARSSPRTTRLLSRYNS